MLQENAKVASLGLLKNHFPQKHNGEESERFMMSLLQRNFSAIFFVLIGSASLDRFVLNTLK